MIKFFRKIRFNLVETGKTGKYLKYAIGEIILVVIGILIALQVNNWNENRKANFRKNTLLKSLKVEFGLNLNQIDSVLYYDNLVVESSFQLLHLDPNKALIMEKDALKLLLQNSSWTWTFDPLTGALRSGVSSGDLNLIESDSLKSLLYNWQDIVADAKEDEARAQNLRLNETVIEKHVRNVNYRSTDRKELGDSKFKSDYIGLISDPLFEDYISNRYSRMKDAVLELNQVRKQNIKILELINKEINTYAHLKKSL